MRPFSRWTAVVCLAVLAAAPSIDALGAPLSDLDATQPSHQARLLNSAAPVNISYFTDAPCPVKPIPHRRLVKRRRRPVHHVVRPHVHHVRRRPLLHKAALPARCEILHRDRLFSPVADAGPVGAAAPEPLAEALAPAGPEVLDADGGAAPAGFVAAGGSPGDSGSSGVMGRPSAAAPGGGGQAGGGPGGSPSAAPEPDAWMLMILGAAVAGASLRRRRSDARGQMASLGRS